MATNTKTVRRQSGLHHPVSIYAKQVTEGKLRSQCNKYEILACQRHLDDLKRQGTEEFPYVFDTTRADRIIRWFGQCIQVRGVFAGKPIEPQPWQIFDQGCLYGWVHKDTGARRFMLSYNKRARGNVKSTENSAKCLYHMCGDAIYPPYHPELAVYEQEPEVDCAAVDRGQAMRVYGDAKKIAEASPNIERRLFIPKSNPVSHRTRGGKMQALSKDTKNKDSGAPSYFCVDEWHAHETREVYDRGRSGFGKRVQCLLDAITTAGDNAENKPCYKDELYYKRMLENPSKEIDRTFIMIRELEPNDNPHDHSAWVKANPMLRFPNEYTKYLLDEIIAEHDDAYGSGDPGKINDFLTRRCCLWQAASVNSYLTEQQMSLARAAQVSREEFAKLTDGKKCNCAFDLGKRVDLSGTAAVFNLEDGRIAIKVHGFLPEDAATRHEHTDRVEYKAWAAGGYCTLTPGAVTDNSYVNNWICEGERLHRWKVEETDYDGHNATDLAIQMCRDRNNDDFCVEIPQTCAGQNLAVKRFRELLLQGRLVLEESPLLMWCLGNAIEVTNNFGDIKLNKRHKDDSQRIDPVAAMMNALARVIVKFDIENDINEHINDDDWGI
ncbi:MAG TPA: terminase TerL endonuclease subunit [Pseudoflavonifractor sp.]|nr:terminase TerL endonuclease subunit [Pseudoflavonifractor sp.]